VKELFNAVVSARKIPKNTGIEPVFSKEPLGGVQNKQLSRKGLTKLATFFMDFQA